MPNALIIFDRWLEVSRQLVSREEYELTRQAVQQFRKNEGPHLQKHLQHKYVVRLLVTLVTYCAVRVQVDLCVTTLDIIKG